MLVSKEVTLNHITYILRAKPSPKMETAVDVEAFKCVGEVSEDGVAHKEYRRRGASSLKHRVRDLNDANRVFTAAIKWDGCSDINFYPDRGGNEQFCGKPCVTNIGCLLGAAYELASELMGDKVDKELFYNL